MEKRRTTIVLFVGVLVLALLALRLVSLTGSATREKDVYVLDELLSFVMDALHAAPRSELSVPDAVCGNNVVEPGEQCDPPGSVCLISPGPNACTSTCQCVAVPTPQATALNPSSVAPTVPFTLEIIGLSFMIDPPARVILAGQTFTPSALTSTRITVNVPGLAAGVYDVQVVNGNQVVSTARQLTVAAQPQSLELTNTHVRMNFKQTTNNVYVESLEDLDTGYVMRFDSTPAWKIELKDHSTRSGQRRSGSPSTFPFSSFRTQITGTTDRVLTATWDDVQIDAANRYDLVLTVTLPADQKVANWKLSAQPHPQNTNRFSLFDVQSPVLSVRTVQDGALLLPFYGGVIVLHPEDRVANFGLYLMHQLSADFHPGQFGLQLMAYLDRDNRELLYLATDDTASIVKRYPIDQEMRGSSSNMVFSFEHIPENNNVPNTAFVQPYNVRIGIMQGDWYDAARYYGQWATQQTWVRRGRLESTAEVPPLVKDAGLNSFLMFTPNPSAPAPPSPPVEDLVEDIRLWKQALGVDHATVHWWFWHYMTSGGSSSSIVSMYDALVRPGISAMLQQAAQNGDLVAPYFFPLMVAIGGQYFTTHNLAGALLLNEHNAPITVADPRWPLLMGIVNFDAPLAPRSFAELFVQETLDPIIDAGFKGIYLDVLTVENSIPYGVQGRPSGDPAAYTRGSLALLTAIRDRLRTRTNNQFYMISEVTSENYISSLDMMYHDASLAAALSLDNAFIVPLWESIYHPYIISTSFQGFTHPLYFVSAYISSGTIPFIPNRFVPPTPATQPFYDFAKQYARARVGYAKKYFVYGERLRDPDFTARLIDRRDRTQIPILPVIYTSYAPNVPIVLPSTWKASDGSLAFVAASWAFSGTPTERITLRVNFADYELTRGTQYTLSELSESGRQVIAIYNDNFILDVNVPPLSMKVFTLEQVTTPVCGNGIIEPGEECEVGIPCTSGTCNTACRCEVAPTPGPGPSGGGGGGGSGGGGSGSVGFVMYLNFDKEQTYAMTVGRSATFFAKYNDRDYSIRVERLQYFPAPQVSIKILPRYQGLKLQPLGRQEIFLDEDTIADIEVKVLDISKNLKATLVFTRLTPFPSRYLGPRREVPYVRPPAPRLEEQISQPSFSEQPLPASREEILQQKDTFYILTRVLAGVLILFIVTIILYALVRRKVA